MADDRDKKPDARKPRVKREERTLECVLTKDEIIEKATQLADALQEARDLEDAKKAAGTAFKKKLDDNDAEAQALGRKVTTGKELRDVIVVTEYDVPVPGLKREYREDTGEELKVCNMSQDECQMALFHDPDSDDEEGEEPGDKRAAK
jgi:hypothetical protein